jgi:NitT/TauT family transport system substrate-binding protein
MPVKLAENFRALFYAPFYAVEALGFYAREGVEVVPMSSPAPAAALPGLLEGTIDLSWGGPMRVMKARDSDPGSQLVCFCEVVARDPFFLVGRGERAGFALADLKRLRLAIVAEVPTPWLCLAHDLRDNGIDPDRLDRVTGATMADNLEALRRGDIDVVQVFEPYASMALKAGIGDILHAASSRGPTVYTTLLATRVGIANNRAAFAAIVRAVHRMQSWLADHGADALAATVAPFYPDVAPEILASSLRRYYEAGVWARSADVSREGFDRLAAALRSGGFVTRLHRYEDCVDPSLQ